MELEAGSLVFGFIAGLLSTLSPCVLPVLPLVLGGAVSAHRFGMAALAGGLVLSFVTVGMFVATVGFSLGLDGDVFRTISAVMLVGLGMVLLSTALQERFAVAASGFGDGANRLITRIAPSGVSGQFLIGVILGAVWSPCVGPTLGAASVLASQGKNLVAVTAVMIAFGLGAAVPLVVIGSLSREAMKRWRGRMLNAGHTGKVLLGGAAVGIAALILTGADRLLETTLVNASPAWLTALTTRF